MSLGAPKPRPVVPPIPKDDGPWTKHKDRPNIEVNPRGRWRTRDVQWDMMVNSGKSPWK